ncbi:FtsP/CotA-like multicopper oxidase with cupredoxin domain [Agromyces flavus]|uniref:FtsP/CotA-like multicopper oxidase with cupredoxin domain n=1 Tax=Agromyces flavus TaxID=589382 RepID=A0A1H1QEY5_9MICO|nr:multicopper oxidase domain-containing protein [Agromyces flavus]MCP2367750.1 FtsP/CotA-like multicopper oxidase with cupredoxin domain [Agromyces flavus]GGI47209.1 multicopper oxidase [Agromyces flavus]SDS21837.1 Multicopper oxidase with three cupredoxin domains (includes cell division protein FtsP and spore coat protein CotA) [Agromyces flavus]
MPPHARIATSRPSAVRRPRAAATALGLLAAGVAVSVAFAGCGLVGPARVSTVGEVDFDTPLPIPPLAPSTIDADGTRVFSLEAQAGTTEFAPGVESETWGFDGAYLGPTLVADRGERVRVDVANGLDVATIVHWHGMHLPAEMDGGPHQMIDPGGAWSPEWTIDQPAATLWYHPHPHGETEQHVARGLAGMFLVRDDAEAALPLPREYGVDDLPVIVQDAAFTDEGRIESSAQGFAGRLGDELLVNGARGPYAEVHDELVRLRLLNASTARSYAFTWEDGRQSELIATDGGLLEASVALDRVVLSPGERAEVLVRVAPGERLTLQSVMTPDAAGLQPTIAAMNGGTDEFDVLELRAAAELDPAPDVPDRLADLPPVGTEDVVETRTFTLDGFQIDGRQMQLDRIDHSTTVGTTERWRVENASAMPHSFHVHDVQFRIASIDGAAPPPELAGWKDTIFVRPETEYELILRFEDYADPDTPYMYHCHLLWHEDQGMMGQFAVVEPGQRATMTEETDHDHH